jgi:large subunit ribosomal protein L32e
MKRFVRAETVRFKRLGKNRKKLQKWRKPKGRHSKMRKKRAGYPISPSIGHGKPVVREGMIKGKVPMLISTMKDFDKASASNIIIISRRIGARKKMEMIKKAHELKLQLLNVKDKKQ